MLFCKKPLAQRHVELPKCQGATVSRRLCGLVKLDDNYVPSRKRQSTTSAMAMSNNIRGNLAGNQNSGTTINDNSFHAHIETLIIVNGNPTGDLIKAGSALESELIRKTILENADLRRMIRTIENAPSAIFRMTKGNAGPQALRNVKRDGRKACELGQEGPVKSGMLTYCKKTAVKMVEELQSAIQTVSDDSPPAVKEWAADVSRALKQKTCSNLDYPTALQLYCEASSRFYKLPEDAREAIASGVRDIGRFIVDFAEF